MKLKKHYVLIVLLGLMSCSVFAQEESAPAPIFPKLILTTNVLSTLGGNTSVNFSIEKPLSYKTGIELDFDYYFNYTKEQKERPVNYLNTTTDNGFGILASYKFLVGDGQGIQFFFGPTLGYRSINYNHELAVCTEVAPENPATGICECLNLEQNFFTSQSRSVIAAANVGFQTNYNIRKGGQFFMKIHANVGGAQFFPTVNGRLETVTCPFVANDVEAEEDNLIRLGQGFYTNHTVQFSDKLSTFVSLNLKLGYAF